MSDNLLRIASKMIIYSLANVYILISTEQRHRATFTDNVNILREYTIISLFLYKFQGLHFPKKKIKI